MVVAQEKLERRQASLPSEPERRPGTRSARTGYSGSAEAGYPGRSPAGYPGSSHPGTRRRSRARNPKRLRLQRRSVLALALAVGIFGAICADTIQLTVVKGAEIRSLEKDISTAKAQNDLLQVQVDKLRSVGRIESAALAMGMVQPSGTVYVAGNLPAVKKSSQATAPKVAGPRAGSAQEAPKQSALHQLAQIFTGLFASAQR
ncbi:cell division protein FtsL [Peptococcaceae bacterium CEB3]|nr:cell division protein FtsL [Peptococcaceae bacterium CEB3]